MLNFNKNGQILFIIMAVIIVILSGILIYKDHIDSDKSKDIILIEDNKTNNNEGQDSGKTENASEKQNIKIYITGRVKNPGVFEVREGTRLEDAVRIAGGMLEDADTNGINLAIRVKDEGMYIIPKYGENALNQENNSLDGLFDGNNNIVNINTADQKQLESLPGIGPSKAKRICEYREKNGLFNSKEEIMNVSGIGQKTYDGLKDIITVN